MDESNIHWFKLLDFYYKIWPFWNENIEIKCDETENFTRFW